MKNKTGTEVNALALLRRGLSSGVFDDAPEYRADVKKFLSPARVTLNKEQRLFVIPCGEGYSCLGFDVAVKWAQAAVSEMNRPDLSPKGQPGTLKYYREYKRVMNEAEKLYRTTGRRMSYELTAQLIGLENKRVEVVDCDGNKRRFYVGKSTGFVPVHLEIARCSSIGGSAVYGAPFRSVRVIGER